MTKDVADDAIVGGNPARLIRKRFDDKCIETLLSIAWWNWPVEKITENLKIINSTDITALKNIV